MNMANTFTNNAETGVFMMISQSIHGITSAEVKTRLWPEKEGRPEYMSQTLTLHTDRGTSIDITMYRTDDGTLPIIESLVSDG